MENNRILMFLLLPFILMGCNGNSITDEYAFLKWIEQPGNGFVKSNSANGFTLKIKYLPPEYLSYLEFMKDTSENSSKNNFKEFESSLTFLFTIEHELNNVDAVNYGLMNMTDYKERINALNFNLKDYLYINTQNGNKMKPVLSNFENLYEIGGKKSFYLVFQKEKPDKNVNNVIDIVFEDPFYRTGISHFVFKLEQINNIPTLQFIN